MRVSRACLVVLLAVTLPLAAQEKKGKKKPPTVPEGVGVVRNLEFAKPDGISLQLDLYLPKEQPDHPIPIVVWVHGGGWKNGSRTKCKASWLAAEGFAVASISYRLTDVAGWPAQIDDCYAAVRWLRKNGREHGLDPNHIGAWGSSAGGHLVALMGTRRYPGDEEVSSEVQAVCDWFGPSELLTMPPNTVGDGRTEEDVAQSNGAKLLRGTVYKQPEMAKDASAIDHVSADAPPILIMHGDQDPGVPLEQSTRFHERLSKAGVASTLHVVKGGGHGGAEFNKPEVQAMVLAFFKQHLKAKPPTN